MVMLYRSVESGTSFLAMVKEYDAKVVRPKRLDNPVEVRRNLRTSVPSEEQIDYAVRTLREKGYEVNRMPDGSFTVNRLLGKSRLRKVGYFDRGRNAFGFYIFPGNDPDFMDPLAELLGLESAMTPKPRVLKEAEDMLGGE